MFWGLQRRLMVFVYLAPGALPFSVLGRYSARLWASRFKHPKRPKSTENSQHHPRTAKISSQNSENGKRTTKITQNGSKLTKNGLNQPKRQPPVACIELAALRRNATRPPEAAKVEKTTPGCHKPQRPHRPFEAAYARAWGLGRQDPQPKKGG